MGPVLPAVNRRKPSIASQILEGISSGIQPGLEIGKSLREGREQRQRQELLSEEDKYLRKKAEELTGQSFEGISGDVLRKSFPELLKIGERKEKRKSLVDFLDKGKEKSSYKDKLDQGEKLEEKKNELSIEAAKEIYNLDDQEFDELETGNIPKKFDVNKFNNMDLAIFSEDFPNAGKAISSAKDRELKEQHYQTELEESKKKEERRVYEKEREYHTKAAIKQDEDVANLRNSLPKKEMALSFSRNAIENKDLGYFSLDSLANITGIPLFRTARGAQLINATKENLLANMSRVSSRAQNMWFEQRLYSMMPQIGNSEEANLTLQEMLEAEMKMDELYLNEFDRLTEQDEEKFGYAKKDRSKRAHENIKPITENIFNRSAYRIQQLDEKEMGREKMQEKVGKNVPKGTPLTLEMGRLYMKKYGDEAPEIAKKNGYKIPESLQDIEYYLE